MPTTRLRGDKPEKCCVLSHYFNNKTNILPIFHNLLSNTFFINKNVAKIKNVKNAFFYKIMSLENSSLEKIIKNVNKRFFTSMSAGLSAPVRCVLPSWNSTPVELWY